MSKVEYLRIFGPERKEERKEEVVFEGENFDGYVPPKHKVQMVGGKDVKFTPA